MHKYNLSCINVNLLEGESVDYAAAAESFEKSIVTSRKVVVLSAPQSSAPVLSIASRRTSAGASVHPSLTFT